MKYGVKKYIKAEVTCQSLVGVNTTEYPVSFGNYCWVDNIKCINMWSENVEQAAQQFLSDGKIGGWYFTEQRKDNEVKWFIVDDERIPTEWLYNKFCWTSGAIPSIELLQEMYSIHGDANNQIEEFIDPKSYYAKQGHEYTILSGGEDCVRYNVNKPL